MTLRDQIISLLLTMSNIGTKIFSLSKDYTVPLDLLVNKGVLV